MPTTKPFAARSCIGRGPRFTASAVAVSPAGNPGVVGNPLEAAHIQARALGGQNRLDNYVALHRKENRGEGSRIARIRAAIEKRQRDR